MKINRNDKCPCENGKKFKKCHLNTQRGKLIQKNYGHDLEQFIIEKMKKENN